jgi:hypothetical protein
MYSVSGRKRGAITVLASKQCFLVFCRASLQKYSNHELKWFNESEPVCRACTDGSVPYCLGCLGLLNHSSAFSQLGDYNKSVLLQSGLVPERGAHGKK